MKKKITKPEISVVKFNAMDVITTSCTCPCGNHPDGSNTGGGCWGCPGCIDHNNQGNHNCWNY